LKLAKESFSTIDRFNQQNIKVKGINHRKMLSINIEVDQEQIPETETEQAQTR
jgi:hypothetical protein